MENLNAEQVKSELEGLAKFRTCPEYIKNALTLINSQEQRIGELTEENKAWQKQLISTEEKSGKAYYNLACEVEDLRAENEKLAHSCTELTQECKKWQGRVKIECEYTRADTVRKMQEMLCEGRVSNDPVVIATNVVVEELLEDGH